MSILKIHLTCSLCNDRLCGRHTPYKLISGPSMACIRDKTVLFNLLAVMQSHTISEYKHEFRVNDHCVYEHVTISPIFNSYSFRYLCAGEISVFCFSVFFVLFFFFNLFNVYFCCFFASFQK